MEIAGENAIEMLMIRVSQTDTHMRTDMPTNMINDTPTIKINHFITGTIVANIIRRIADTGTSTQRISMDSKVVIQE